MECTRKMNVLVLGNSGVGKSTLIKAISGTEVKTAAGEGVTQKIDVYESTTWPIRCIDTKGFEYSWIEQQKTIYQIKKYTKQQLTTEIDENGNEPGIDAVWYCIDGCAKRVFSQNIEMMNKAIRGWKNIPVFVVITKSIAENEIAENIEAVNKAFAKSKPINLQKIIPVIAEPYYIRTEIVEQMGIEELCEATLNCSDEAKSISIENRTRMKLEQKRSQANVLTAGATAIGVVVAAVPIPFPDSAILVPLETALAKGIFKKYDVEFNGELVTAVISSAAVTNLAKTAISALKAVPIAGPVLNAVVAGFFVTTIGEAIIALSEAIYLKKIDPSKIEKVVEFITEKLKNTPLLSSAIKYIEENVDKLQGKSAKEIISLIMQAVQNGIDKSKK